MWRPTYVVGSCLLAKPGSDLQCKCTNRQHAHALFENTSASIGTEARLPHLVFRNTELSDHPEHEAIHISSFPPLSAACIALSALMSTMLTLCCVCLCCRSEPDFIVTFKKMCKIVFVNRRYWKIGNVRG